MAKNKKTKSVKKSSSRYSLTKSEITSKASESEKSGKNLFLNKKNIIILALIVLSLLAWKAKDYFIVATVNNQPISRSELSKELYRRFGQQILDVLINERLILSAARQKGVFIATNSIDSRIKQIEESLQGQMSLDDALKAQGLDMDGFKKQLEIQLSIEQMFENEATLSASEVDDYIKENAEAYKNSTDPAALKEQVASMLKQQKISQLFETWFQGIRNDAKINTHL
jgi:hypothetical protein